MKTAEVVLQREIEFIHGKILDDERYLAGLEEQIIKLKETLITNRTHKHELKKALEKLQNE